jgi:LysR family transcriptional regulator, glycine cleavage system transcriptional activator
MSNRLPPLNALRVFEVAARHLNFTAAATELCVTSAAVSHQIRALEEHVGVTLFVRRSGALELTEAGAILLPEVREAFNRLHSAARGLRQHMATNTLNVSVPNSFAAKWLAPRLPSFHDLFPEIQVRVETSSELVDFARDDIDLAIRYGSGDYPCLHTELLSKSHYFPVCSPAVASGPPPLLRPKDLERCELLHDELPPQLPTTPVWRNWLDLASVTSVDADAGPRFNTSFFTIEMAVAGMGVALGQDILVAGDLASGRLVRPFSPAIDVGLSYYVVCTTASRHRREIVAFRTWLRDEMTRSELLMQQFTGCRADDWELTTPPRRITTQPMTCACQRP